MTSPPDLSIVVLSYNVAGLLAECLRSLPAAAGEWWERTEALVVDNASGDGSVEMARRDFPHARVIALAENRGFSGGNNVGIRAARGKYVLLINADTVARPGSIAALADYMEAHPEVGIVGPKLLNPDGSLQPSRRRFPTLATALLESTPLQRWLPDARILRHFYMLDRPDEETQEVGWLSGAALMCRREALWQVGLLDPGYFMFSEEVDLCRRVNNAGWRVVYLPGAEITHYGGQSTGQDVPARHVHFNTSKARYFRVHEGRVVGKLVRYYLLGVYAVQALSEGVKWLLGHKRPLRAERLRMYRQVLRNGLRERRRLAGERRVLLITGEYPPARGGVGDYTCRLGLALGEKGVAVRVLAQARPANSFAGNTRQSPLSGTGADGLSQSSAGQPPLQVGRITIPSALRALRGTRSRIAHIQYQTGAYDMRPTVNVLPLLLRLTWRGRVVVTFHDLRVPYLFPKAGPVREWANRLLARTADAAIATNPEDAAQLRAWGVRRVELIPIGSNIPNNPPDGYNRDEWRARWGASEGTTLLAYFGFLNSSKGLDDLLQALAILRQHGDYRLLMVGGGTGSSDPTNRATAAHLTHLARELGAQDRLIWTGYLSPREVSAVLLSADMAVLPFADGASFRRGSLMAILEHGLPLITTTGVGSKFKVQGSRFKVQAQIRNPKSEGPQLVDGENALLVEPGDVEALVGAIRRMAEDGELRKRLASGARELAQLFDWRRIAQMHRELYEDLPRR